MFDKITKAFQQKPFILLEKNTSVLENSNHFSTKEDCNKNFVGFLLSEISRKCIGHALNDFSKSAAAGHHWFLRLHWCDIGTIFFQSLP